MANKLRRCLYIGLGGTGMTSLLHTKRAFIETYGEVPPMIAFLGIDTDGGQFRKELDSIYGPVRLTPNEQLKISVNDAFSIYQVHKSHFGWLSEECKYALSNLGETGAGQVRSNGRFCMINHSHEIEDVVRQKLNDIQHAVNIDNEKYELLSDQPEMHMVFSLCGGTGSGTFLDIAYLLRRITSHSVKLAGYAVLPDVFEAMSSVAMDKVKPNAFGAIKDLDYLMSFGMGDNDRLECDYITSGVVFERRPFTAMFLVDNKSQGGNTHTHVDALAEMISSALTTSAGELSTAAASTLDNFAVNLSEGIYDVGDKKAWVASLGTCEIEFRGSELRKIYALKAAQRIVNRLYSSCEDANIIANSWIDAPEVNIRENGGSENDNVIDYLLDKSPKYSMSTVDNDADGKSDADNYISTVATPKAEELAQRRQDKSAAVRQELDKLVTRQLNSECGVGKTLDVLDALEMSVKLFLREMNEEHTYWTERLPSLDNAIKVASDELREYAAKMFKTKSGLEEKRGAVANAATQKGIAIREQARRAHAITFFNGLLNDIADERTKVETIKQQLSAVNTEISGQIMAIQNRINRNSSAFCIDLAEEYAMKLTVKDEDLSIEDFKRFTSFNVVDTFGSMTREQILNKLLEYTMKLPEAKRWSNMTIEDVLKEVKAADEGNFKKIIERALKKASPLLCEDYRGHLPRKQPHNIYYVGVADQENSVLKQERVLEGMLHGQNNINYANIGMSDRVIIYCQRGNMPAFAVGPISTYKERYLQQPPLYHFDAKLLRRMERENFSLLPAAEEEDDTLELWVKGLIFGKIKNEEGRYKIQNMAEGEPIMDYWIDLPSYRDEAYEEFARMLPQVRRDFTESFDSLASQIGEEAMRKKLDDVKRNYMADYSQLNMTTQELTKHGNEPVRSLVNKELVYVKDNL